jgi:signal transduction histidine kinase/ActR/RegA family two-component response regulator
MLDPSLFQSAFEHLPIGAYLLTPTADAVVLAVNDAFLRSTERTREQMVGCSLFEVFPADPDDPTDTGESALRASILRAVATGQPQTMPVQRYPICKLLPSGEAIYEERFWNAVNTPIAGPDGTVACILHVTQEVTAQVRAESALRQSERDAHTAAAQAEAARRRLDAVLGAVPVGIVMSDEQGRIVLTNNAHRQLWGEYQPCPESVDDFRHWKGWWADGSDRQGQPVAPMEWPTARVLRGEPAPRDLIEIAPFDRGGERRIALFTGAPVRGPAGLIVGAVVAQLDITDRVSAEESLRQANRRKDEFLAMLAHELRNPLAPIGAAADLLARGTLDAKRVRQTSGIISRQMRHMTGLIDDLLDVSRVTQGLIKMDKERLDLKPVVAEALEQTRPLIEAHGHRVTVHTPPLPAIVCGDAKRLVQVVANLLTNAAKYTPEGGGITLDLELDGGHVKINVTDTGVGMTPELLERAFELFAQSERTVDRAQGGLGIGLALVKRLMEQHGGSVHAVSEGPGQGSRFTLCLPRLDASAADMPERATTAPLVAVGDGLRVMIVDDNADAATMLAMLIDMLGHQAHVEHRAQSALERARTERPQVCLLDIGLPDISGIELARRLRTQPETAQATLIAVSGYGQDENRAAALAAGFDHYFVKPVDSNRLADLLAALAERLSG